MSPNIRIDRLLSELQTRSHELCVQNGWTMISVARRASYVAGIEEEIEIVVRPPYGEMLFRIIRISLDMFYLGEETISEVARQHIRELERDMAQWNQRQADRLREQEEQRRRAQGRERPSVAFNTGMATPDERLGYDPSNRIADRAFVRQSTDNMPSITDWISTQTTIMSSPYTTITPGSTWQTSPVTVSIPSSETEYGVTTDMVRSLIAEALKSLDIRIAIDHSDGEVEVEVEVSYNGEVIASDSDHVSI